MKTISRPTFSILASTLILGSTAFVPVAAISSTGTAKSSATSPFCTNLSTRATTATSKISDLRGKLATAWSNQDSSLSSKYASVDQNVAQVRTQADTERTSNFGKLEAKATTDAQKQAVQTYETAVKNAVTIRRAAYDAARQTFRDGVKSAIDSRRSTITSQTDAFSSAVQSALSSAEASCNTDSSVSAGQTARTTLVASLKTARETFQADRKNDATVGSQATQLAATRDAAFKAADQTFQASMTTARTALQKAFGSTSV